MGTTAGVDFDYVRIGLVLVLQSIICVGSLGIGLWMIVITADKRWWEVIDRLLALLPLKPDEDEECRACEALGQDVLSRGRALLAHIECGQSRTELAQTLKLACETLNRDSVRRIGFDQSSWGTVCAQVDGTPAYRTFVAQAEEFFDRREFLKEYRAFVRDTTLEA